ncbi:MAG: alginate lyase family protein [Candidatus Latescibacteria bacterium]|nr:alginate lyase family protein [Candidatus Latescibacterota bacterium]
MPTEPVRVFLLDAGELEEIRRALGEGADLLEPADQRLLQEANEVVDGGILNQVLELPALCGAVQTLALAYYLSDHEPFAEGAALLLRRAFLDEGAEFGPQPGAAVAVAQRLPLAWLVDAVGLIGASPAWSRDDQQGLEEWAGQYLDWLLHSEPGQEAGHAADHLGTWAELQIAALGLFTGREADARQVLAERVPVRLASQLDVMGRQPFELRHDDALSACLANLVSLFDLADLGRHVGVDLWSWQGAGGRSLQRACSWLVLQGIENPWPHPQEGFFDPVCWVPLLRRAARRWADSGLEMRLRDLPEVDWAADRTNLLYPAKI